MSYTHRVDYRVDVWQQTSGNFAHKTYKFENEFKVSVLKDTNEDVQGFVRVLHMKSFEINKDAAYPPGQQCSEKKSCRLQRIHLSQGTSWR